MSELTPPQKTSNFYPAAFEQALMQVHESDGFSHAVNYAVNEAGCEFLFEVPAMLFDREGQRAAVIRRQSPENSAEDPVLFVIFDNSEGVVRILEPFEVPDNVQRMTSSYSNLLEHLSGLFRKRTVRYH